MNVDLILSRLGGSISLYSFQGTFSTYLASLRGLALSLSSWILFQSSTLLYISSVTILAFVSWLSHSRTSSKHTALEDERVNDALEILAKALIPTRSNWYPSYVEICRRTVKRTKKQVYVPVKTLFRDVVQGRIELRSSSDDLSLLIGGSFEANDWSVHLKFSLKDRMFAALWLVDMELASGVTVRSSSDMQEIARALMGEAEVDVCLAVCVEPLAKGGDRGNSKGSSHRSSFFTKSVPSSEHETAYSQRRRFSALSKSMFICPSLDYVSRYHIPDFLRALQLAFRWDKRALAYLSFTTSENPPSMFSFKHMCISKLFMRKHKRDATLQKTSSPLFNRLHPILARLTSGPAALTMCNVQNVSSKYAAELDKYAERLIYDPDTRTAFIKKAGIQAWREERLYVSWESALLKEGLISRWVLLMGKGYGN